MTDYRIPSLDQFRDPPAVWFYNAVVADGMAPSEALIMAADFNRDRCRTPMQWSNSFNAGFSSDSVPTWLPVNPNHAEGINVAEQQNDPASLLSFYKRLLRLRKQTPALIDGDYKSLDETQAHYFAFLRRSAISGQTCLVVLNLSDQEHQAGFDLDSNTARCLFSTHMSEGETLSLDALKIRPFEIFIGELKS
jgi:alpha-glucosidase